MKKLAYAAVLAVVSTVIAPSAAAESYQIDPGHTSVIFGISHMGLSYTYGRFNKVSGSYELDRENMAASQFKLTIDASSIDTNSQNRDQHLRGPDFFNAAQFPLISFESTKVVPQTAEDGKTHLNVVGNLTMHGVTKRISFDLLLVGEAQGPRGDHRTGFHTDAKLKRSDFGMTGMIPAIGDEVAVTISFEGVRQQGGGASVNRRVRAVPVSAKTPKASASK